jgi:hypothetical protein
MKIQRERAYRPELVFKDTDVEITWNYPNINDKQNIPTVHSNPTNDYDNIDLTNDDVEISESFNGYGVKIDMINIGVGVAKNIEIAINMDEVLQPLIDKINLLVGSKYSLQQHNNYITFRTDKHETGMVNNFHFTKLYMLPNVSEKEELIIPGLITGMIREYYRMGIGGSDLINALSIPASIKFEDIQGKSYHKQIYFQVEKKLVLQSLDGSGHVIYTIKVCE